MVGSTDAKDVAMATCVGIPNTSVKIGTNNPPPPPPKVETNRPIGNPNNGKKIMLYQSFNFL